MDDEVVGGVVVVMMMKPSAAVTPSGSVLRGSALWRRCLGGGLGNVRGRGE